MIDFTSYYAQSTLWSAPRMDNQSILDMARLSLVTGVYNRIRVADDSIKLPVQRKKFHVFQIGQLMPELLGMISCYEGRWVRLDVMMQMKNMIIDTYLVNGIMYPRHHVWFQWTETRNLLICFEDVPALGDHNLENYEPFIRFYTGGWFHVLRKDKPKDMIKVYNKLLLKEADRLEAWNYYNDHKDKVGHTFLYLNGVYYSDLTYQSLKIGTVLEIVYDTTVYKKVKMAIEDLNAFDSILDEKRKYLLTYAGSMNNPTIDFYDDIDVYITGIKDMDGQTAKRGVLYHRNNKDAVRQLTHRDYSIVVPYVAGYTEVHPFLQEVPLKNQFVEMFIRKSGFQRGTVFVHNRIHDLYKLPYRHKVSAMLGVRSNVDVWRADQLELSAYSQVMSMDEAPRDKQLIEDAYGYNALSIVYGNTPVHKSEFLDKGGVFIVPLANNLQGVATHFEYDEEGKLLGYYNSENTCNHVVRNENCHMVESMVGFGGVYIDDQFNPPEDTLIDETFDYRIYRCLIGKEYQGLENWEDITDLNYHRVIDGKLKWVENMDKTHTVILRTNKKVLVREYDVSLTDGLLHFPIVQTLSFTKFAKDDVQARLMVPMGQLDVWLNGHALVEGIDFMVDFPHVYITSKKYIEDASNFKKQHVVIRFSQFCDKSMNRIPVKETGYIYDGQLSNNKRYNIHDDKVLGIIAAGGRFHRKEVGFFDKQTKNTNPHLKRSEGYPYQIKDIIVPMRKQIPTDTYTLRYNAEVIDDKVSQYMTQFQEQKVLTRHPEIRALYPLYSPMLSKIIYDLKYNAVQFPEELLYHRYTDQDVLEFVKPYEYLMKVDPVFNDESIDLEYVIIHPHIMMDNIPLNIYHYRLLNRIVKLVFKDKVKLSHFVRSIPIEHT